MPIWDQQPNESNAAYARFLAYRNLGPGRTLERAAQQNPRNSNSIATYERDSSTHNWVERATAWDVANLLVQGKRAATLYVAAVERAAERLLEALESGVKPDDFNSITKALELLSKLFPGESIAYLAERSGKPTNTTE